MMEDQSFIYGDVKSFMKNWGRKYEQQKEISPQSTKRKI
jgi:hypothetical protein